VGFYLFASRVPKRVIVVLQRVCVSSSYSPILHSVEITAQGELAKTRIRVRNQPFMLLYDNFNIYNTVQDERIHNKNIQHNNTVGAVVFLKTQQGDPWPKQLPQDKQTVSRAEQLPNLLDAHSGDQSRSYTLAPEQWWIRLEEIGDFTTHDALAPLFESVHTNMPRISEPMICDTLWSFAGAEIGLKEGRSGQESLRFEPPEVYKLFPTRIDAARMKAFDLDEASISGNSQIPDAIIHELDLDTDKLGDNFLVPISGDQLTVQRLRFSNRCRSFDEAKAVHKLQWVMPISER
jgi:hypothetical protein